MGYQIVMKSGFTMDFFAGLCFLTSVIKDSTRDVEISGNLSGFGVRMGMTLGWSF